jgi:murein DD-endopeptidase MepM/ murein hydrolase activator NlpD
METDDRLRRRGLRAAGTLISLALMLAGCARSGPAPVITGEQAPPPAQIIVQRGQTLSGIAHAHHVPMTVLAEANRLAPPYRILVGQALIIPAGGAPNPSGPTVAMAEPAPPPDTASPAPMEPPVSARPLLAPAPEASHPIPLDRPLPAAASEKARSTPEPAYALTPPSSAKFAAKESATSTRTATPPREHKPPAAEPSVASAEALPPSAHSRTAFVWPVRGHVLEGFGAGPDGTHNDGINIAAARGAAIEATDGGIVAYTGNELRGYGNLILIKHPGGWISAYAHCDLILVKPGQKVVRGQVIARVGSTGNVSAPQLHFELRRGKKPVDPREYLAPLATATAAEEHPS